MQLPIHPYGRRPSPQQLQSTRRCLQPSKQCLCHPFLLPHLAFDTIPFAVGTAQPCLCRHWPTRTWRFGLLAQLLQLHTQATSPALPIWVTEYGINDQNAQPHFPWHAFTALLPGQLPQGVLLHACIWFCCSDGMVNGFGLVRDDRMGCL